MRYRIKKYTTLSGREYFVAEKKEHWFNSWTSIDCIYPYKHQGNYYGVPEQHDTIESAFHVIEDNWKTYKNNYVTKCDIINYHINSQLEVEIEE